MPEDVIGKLARFTPAAAAVDRDALLFRAGRASAPSRRPWQAAAGLLAVTQAVTLGVWAFRPAEVGLPTDRLPTASTTPPAADPDPPTGGALDPSSYLVLSHRDVDGPPPAPAGPTTDDPPMAAGQRLFLY